MATTPVERRLAAILAADVAGYSRHMERDEDGTFARLKRLRDEVLEPVLARHGGRVVDLKGDGAMIEFRSAVAAVEAAVDIQRALRDRDAELPEAERIRSADRDQSGRGDRRRRRDLRRRRQRGGADREPVRARRRLADARGAQRGGGQARSRSGPCRAAPAQEHRRGRGGVPGCGPRRRRAVAAALDPAAGRALAGSRRRRLLPLLVLGGCLVDLAGDSASHAQARRRRAALRQSRRRRGDREAGPGDHRGRHHRSRTVPRPRRDRPHLDRRPTRSGRSAPARYAASCDVDYVLEGSIQRQGDRVRVTRPARRRPLGDATSGPSAGTARPRMCSPCRPSWPSRSPATSAGTVGSPRPVGRLRGASRRRPDRLRPLHARRRGQASDDAGELGGGRRGCWSGDRAGPEPCPRLDRPLLGPLDERRRQAARRRDRRAGGARRRAPRRAAGSGGRGRPRCAGGGAGRSRRPRAAEPAFEEALAAQPQPYRRAGRLRRLGQQFRRARGGCGGRRPAGPPRPELPGLGRRRHRLRLPHGGPVRGRAARARPSAGGAPRQGPSRRPRRWPSPRWAAAPSPRPRSRRPWPASPTSRPRPSSARPTFAEADRGRAVKAMAAVGFPTCARAADLAQAGIAAPPARVRGRARARSPTRNHESRSIERARADRPGSSSLIRRQLRDRCQAPRSSSPAPAGVERVRAPKRGAFRPTIDFASGPSPFDGMRVSATSGGCQMNLAAPAALAAALWLSSTGGPCAQDGVVHRETGTASFYGTELAGRRTASGERYDPARAHGRPPDPAARGRGHGGGAGQRAVGDGRGQRSRAIHGRTDDRPFPARRPRRSGSSSPGSPGFGSARRASSCGRGSRTQTEPERRQPCCLGDRARECKAGQARVQSRHRQAGEQDRDRDAVGADDLALAPGRGECRLQQRGRVLQHEPRQEPQQRLSRAGMLGAEQDRDDRSGHAADAQCRDGGERDQVPEVGEQRCAKPRADRRPGPKAGRVRSVRRRWRTAGPPPGPGRRGSSRRRRRRPGPGRPRRRSALSWA